MPRKHPIESILENVERSNTEGKMKLVLQASQALTRIASLHQDYYDTVNSKSQLGPSELRRMAKIFEEEADIVESLEKAAKELGITTGGNVEIELSGLGSPIAGRGKAFKFTTKRRDPNS